VLEVGGLGKGVNEDDIVRHFERVRAISARCLVACTHGDSIGLLIVLLSFVVCVCVWIRATDATRVDLATPSVVQRSGSSVCAAITH
jgi:hypothetical protein